MPLTFEIAKGTVGATPEDKWAVGAETPYEVACQDFEAGKLRHKHLETYRPNIADICKDFN